MTITSKREKFCQQLALGKTKTEAYSEAFDTTNMNRRTVAKRASELSQVEAVAERIDELQTEIEQELKYTAKQSFDEFERIRRDAVNCGALLVALRAEELKGKLAGLYDRENNKQFDKPLKPLIVQFVGPDGKPDDELNEKFNCENKT